MVIFLVKSQILHLTNKVAEANEVLEQAESIAEKVSQSDDSELIRAIQEARISIST